MSGMLWELPGPRRFLETVENDIRDGNNEVIAVPARLGEIVGRAVRDRLRTDEITIRRFEALQAHDAPLIQLQYALNPGRSVDPRALPDVLLHLQELAGQVVWLDSIGEEDWSAWCRFLGEYTRAARGVPVLYRPVFAVVAEGRRALNLPLEEVGLSIRRWENVLRRIDSVVLVDELLGPFASSREVERSLVTEVISCLAAWDWRLAERMCAGAPLSVFYPEAVLRSHAAEVNPGMGLTRTPREFWADGLAADTAGNKCHLIALQDKGFSQELRVRLWSAQISVLMPFVEEARLEIVEQLQGQLAPMRYEASEVEIGELFRLVESGQIRVSYNMAQVVRALRRVRNKLAHREPVDLADLNALGLFRGIEPRAESFGVQAL